VFQKADTRFIFCDNFGKYTPILTIFTIKTRSVRSINMTLRLPPHLYYVVENKTANINATLKKFTHSLGKIIA